MRPENQIIYVVTVLSQDLTLRYNANVLFDYIESFPEKNIELDFTDVKSITRSFAHEYLYRKAKCHKTIREINVPEGVYKMFEIVEFRKKLELPA